MAKRNLEKRTLFDFQFKRSKCLSEDVQTAGKSSISSHASSQKPEATEDVKKVCQNNSEKEKQTSCVVYEVNKLDIGLYLNVNLSDEIKYKLLTAPWMPEETFKFPVTSARKLKFQLNWIKRFPWLVYTQVDEQGALCRYCSVFQRETAGKGDHQKLSNLVAKPFNKWKTAIETFTNHSKCQYHITNSMYADNYLQIYSNGRDIRMQLDTARSKQILENRKKLIPIIETIILCGRQELPLRGSCDSGPLIVGKPEPEINDGNFRALLRMRLSSGDQDLKDHFTNSTLNAMYISPDIQNNIIKICGKILQQKLVERINKAKSFAILVDGTTDISRMEQLSLCVRYTVDNKYSFSLREDFLEFIAVHDTTGRNIANVVLETLQKLGVNCSYLIGQGYDGAAAMSGCFKGVQAVIKEKYPAALYVHCSAHSLNLALAHSCQVQELRNCIGTIKSIGQFIKMSSKRSEVLQRKIKEDLPQTKWKKLTAMCETRWVENHDGLLRFEEIYVPILESLEELESDCDIDTSSKAARFSKSITTSQFVISLITATTLFSYTLPLCKILQSINCDLTSALDHIEYVVEEIKSMRQRIDVTFGDIFNKAEVLLSGIGETIRIPRIVSHQKNRCNIEASTPEQYFRSAIAIPVFDDFICQLERRFTNHKSSISALSKLLPSKCVETTFVETDFLIYTDFIDNDFLISEINIWKRKWEGTTEIERPSNATEALCHCKKEFFPNVHFLLKVFATLPVSISTPERTFSSLRRLKTYLRNSTGQDRLTGLALLSIHRDININPEEVIDKFAAEKERRLDLL